jgi:hypothetical protein
MKVLFDNDLEKHRLYTGERMVGLTFVRGDIKDVHFFLNWLRENEIDYKEEHINKPFYRLYRITDIKDMVLIRLRWK